MLVAPTVKKRYSSPEESALTCACLPSGTKLDEDRLFEVGLHGPEMHPAFGDNEIFAIVSNPVFCRRNLLPLILFLLVH